MRDGNGDLSQRRENQRDMRSVVSILQFDLEQIKRHFEESMEAITSLGAVADAIAVEKPQEAEAIWRMQLVLVESALDFYMHELSKYGIQRMFVGNGNRTNSVGSLKVPISKVVSAVKHPESLEWLLEYANDKVSHEIYLEPGDMKRQCSLLGINFEEICNQTCPSCKERLKELYQRRNQIAHQTDRRHEDAIQEGMTRQFVLEAIEDIRHFVDMHHESVKNK